MNAHETETTARPGLGRRTVLKGAAWSVPAVTLVATTAAAANSLGFVTIDTIPEFLFSGNVAAFAIGGTTPALPESHTIVVTIGDVVAGSVTVAAGATSWTIAAANASAAADGAGLVVIADSNSDLIGPAQTTILKDTVAELISPLAIGRVAGTISGNLGETLDTLEYGLSASTGTPTPPTTLTGITPNDPWTQTFSPANNTNYAGRLRATDTRGNVTLYGFSFTVTNENQDADTTAALSVVVV